MNAYFEDFFSDDWNTECDECLCYGISNCSKPKCEWYYVCGKEWVDKQIYDSFVEEALVAEEEASMFIAMMESMGVEI
jgi:hypothetical protein